MQLYMFGAGIADHIVVRSLLVASLAAVLAAAAVPARGFGPGNCVSITRIDGGTCMLRTNCTTQDVSSFDFSFLCVKQPAGQEMHSLGVGSFDQVEEFDTEVQCDQCLPPLAAHAAKPAVQTPLRTAAAAPKVVQKAKAEVPVPKGATRLVHEARTSTAASAKSVLRKLKKPETKVKHEAGLNKSSYVQAKTSLLRAGRRPKDAAVFLEKESLDDQEEPSLENLESDDDSMEGIPEKAEHYGPASCVAVWRNVTTGSCVMQTDCDQPAALSIYEFGLVCIDKADKMTKHVFGMDSFKLQERFDTLIECEECHALDEYTNGDKAIKQLAKEVQEMQGDLVDVSKGVTRLNEEVQTEAVAKETQAQVKAAAANLLKKAQEEGGHEEVAKEAQTVEEEDGNGEVAEEAETAEEEGGNEEADKEAETAEGEGTTERAAEEAGTSEEEGATAEAAEEAETTEEEGAHENVAKETERTEEDAAKEETADQVEGNQQQSIAAEEAAVNFLRQARHKHKHHEVRQVRRRHVQVKQEDVGRAEAVSNEAADDDKADRYERLELDGTREAAAEADTSERAETDREQSEVASYDGERGEVAADDAEGNQAEGSSDNGSSSATDSEESDEDAASKKHSEERASEESESED